MTNQGAGGVPEPWENVSPWLSDDQPTAPALIGSPLPLRSHEPAESLRPRLGEPHAAAAAARIAYIPAARFRPGDASVRFEVRSVEGGRLALLAYSSLELLVAGCGGTQPWVAVRLDASDALAELARACGADIALWDVNLPADGRHAQEPDRGGTT